MRWHHAIDHAIRTPSAVRRVMQMRAIRCDDLFQIFDSAHEVSEVFREP
jgi:hypothetical protein